MDKLLQIITDCYSQFSFYSSLNLKTLFHNKFEQLAKQQGFNFPINVYDIKDYSSLPKGIRKDMESLKKIKTFIKNNAKTVFPRYPISFASGVDILQAMLNESLFSLQKSIYWFFHYRFSKRTGFLIPAMQSLYYSEFFAFISLSRFLGLAITQFPELGKIETIINWSNNNIKSSPIGKGKGAHIVHFNLLEKNMRNFSFLPKNIIEHISYSRKFFLKEERESKVYEFEKASRVFNKQEWRYDIGETHFYPDDHCFIGGSNGRGILEPHQSENFDQSSFDSNIQENYGDWGYKEHEVGVYLKLVIDFLKKVNVKNSNDFLHELSNIIREINIGIIKENEKSDLLYWIEK